MTDAGASAIPSGPDPKSEPKQKPDPSASAATGGVRDDGDRTTALTMPPIPMKPRVWQGLFVWLVLLGLFSVVSLVACWPDEPGAQSAPAASSLPSHPAARARPDSAGVPDSARSSADSAKKAVAVAHGGNGFERACRLFGVFDLLRCVFVEGFNDSQRIFMICLFAGMLGACTAALGSLVNFRGERALISSWALWYVAQPFLGGFLGVILFVVIRGGLIKSDALGGTLNIFGICALSLLSGLSTDEALHKLAELFSNFFDGSAKKRSDQIPNQEKELDTGKAGTGTTSGKIEKKNAAGDAAQRND